MKWYVVLALAAGFLVGADEPKKDKGKKGTTALEGFWCVRIVSTNGTKETEFDMLVFKGNNLTVVTKNENQMATFKIDPRRKWIDITPSEKWEFGVGQKGKTMKGIYQHKGDELRVCYSLPGKDRPKDFEKGQVLLALIRATAK